MSGKATTKVQVNVDQKVVNRVNLILKSIGQSPTSIINSLYHAIDNTGKIPFEIGLTAKQKAALDIQQIASNQPTKVIHNAKKFEEIWADEDED